MYSITTFYKFSKIPSSALESVNDDLARCSTDLSLKGLILLGTEGINATISGSQESIDSFKSYLATVSYFEPMLYKDSLSSDIPFKRLSIQIREEIVTLGKPELYPLQESDGTHLSPQEWERVMQQEDVILLDTRNTYETALGTFKGALVPEITEFSQFPKYVEQAGLPKDKKILMYCTGGIRCEKAILEMHSQGFNNVFQLDGGILNYLAELPHKSFEGECFVFDKRVSVDQDLAPSSHYKLCPHCGNPGDVKILCGNCNKAVVICSSCKPTPERNTCSKNCAYHFNGHPLE